eukprot:CAMPEP_0172562976 /NCGR_PEP_ID=MMETSP1067-20121228/99056_1 /TAXON_ID=265564 ORGANISM="Thalassiosira punctigera, Strain Tpunct2005C2" /NCGR_SAMPLE_ID=MMETSP1067 /ASSEMBLY_ACC=CAM_ASM_000444 /LENGTH=52 /DNA_ID=CAMNT_0013353311 /DNA_START=268 /DNA_END=423 /DNA_ORIENTATION=-
MDENGEYYPRHKRAPYLHDVSDFGIRPSSASSRHHAGTDGGEGWDSSWNEDG